MNVGGFREEIKYLTERCKGVKHPPREVPTVGIKAMTVEEKVAATAWWCK